jgi:arginine/ornithine N-succinyltransferase beta subunit
VRRSRLLPATLDKVDPVPDNPAGGVPWLVGNRSFERFRAILATAPPRVDRLPLEPHQAAALDVREGDLVRVVPLSPYHR